jgi:hypothetical protein
VDTQRRNIPQPIAVLAVLLLALTACAGDRPVTDEEASPAAGDESDAELTQDDTTEAPTSGDDEAIGLGATDVCSPLLATSATVGEVFGGEVSVQLNSVTFSEMAGELHRCTYTLEGGPALFVEVDQLGTADEWSAIRASYDEHRGPLTPVDGIGDEAFHPDGRQHLVVLAEDVVFSVDTFEGSGAEQEVRELAQRIATDLR